MSFGLSTTSSPQALYYPSKATNHNHDLPPSDPARSPDRYVTLQRNNQTISLKRSDLSTATIERILSLNNEDIQDTDPSNPTPSSSLLGENGQPIWKVLVFDNLGRDIISSVLRVNDLRAKGVTIHL